MGTEVNPEILRRLSPALRAPERHRDDDGADHRGRNQIRECRLSDRGGEDAKNGQEAHWQHGTRGDDTKRECAGVG